MVSQAWDLLPDACVNILPDDPVQHHQQVHASTTNDKPLALCLLQIGMQLEFGLRLTLNFTQPSLL